jgi:tetratricopeptide (TPR) repeat protein
LSTVGNWAYVLSCRVAVAGARRGHDPLKLAHKIRHLGDAYYYARRPTRAEPCYVEALAIYRRHQKHTQPLDLANALRSFAVLEHEAGATQEAERLWQEAHDLYVAVNASAGVAESAARLALLAQGQGDLQQSRARLSEAHAAADTTADPETLQYIRDVTAQIGN